LAVIAAALLLIALADLPYGYYTFLRIFVCATSAFGALRAHQSNQSPWALVLAGGAILFNPVIPIYFSRETWAIIDVVAAVIIGLSALSVGKSYDTEDEG
jgi:uncharacterized membrane protein